MSNKRAAIRREKKAMRKAAASNTKMAELTKVKRRGMTDGRILAVSAVLEILHDRYHFGQRRVDRLLLRTSDESAKCVSAATKFNMEFYADKILKKLDGLNVGPELNGIEEQIYHLSRTDNYVTACAVMMLALSEEFGFSSKYNDTGRLDIIMGWCANRYIEALLDPVANSPQSRFEKMKKKTGLLIEQ